MADYRKGYGPQGCFQQGGTSLLLLATLFGALVALVLPRRKRGR